ncbi:histidinol dehydrogenase [Chloroflexota bacterium]
MKIIENFAAAKKVLSRQTPTISIPVSARLRESLQNMFGTDDPEQAVRIIIGEVRDKGDKALIELTQRIDGIRLISLEIGKKEIADAYRQIDRELVTSLQQAATRIEAFHIKQRDNLWHEIREKEAGQLLRPLQRVGVYVPGGTAAYPSTVLMTAIPAKAAGVSEVILTTPPTKNGRIPPVTLVAADIAGVDRVFSVGGAQAIAALAYGTESIPVVDKVCGPGNIFVMLAKKQVFGSVDIDGLQGPSEVMLVADETANAEFCAADILAQAEHDVLASAVLVTTSRKLAEAVEEAIENQLQELSRINILTPVIENAVIAVVENMAEAIELVNLYAPEHLCLMLEKAGDYISEIKNAGCIIAGRDATVVLGDYVAGPSHALPTGGTARFSSPLNVADFIKFTSVVHADEAMVRRLGPLAAIIARAEGLDAHARAIERRLKKDG